MSETETETGINLPGPGQLERTLRDLTLGVVRGTQWRRRMLADTHTGEFLQQLRVPLTGVATNIWASVERAYTWEFPFLYASAQRLPQFLTPHFMPPGIEMTSGAGLIHIHAQVVGWNVTEENWYIGATMRFLSQAPLAADGESVPYSAIAHLTFQGYATAAEGDEYTQ